MCVFCSVFGKGEGKGALTKPRFTVDVALAVLYSSDTRRAVHDLCGLVLMRGMRLLAADPFRQADVLVYLSDLAVRFAFVTRRTKLCRRLTLFKSHSGWSSGSP